MSHQHCAPTEHNYQAINEPSPSGYWYLSTYTYRTLLYCTKCGHHFFIKKNVEKPVTFTTTYTNPAICAGGTTIQWSSFSVTNTYLWTTNQPPTTQQTSIYQLT